MKTKKWVLMVGLLFIISGCTSMNTRTECVCKGALVGAAIGAGSGAAIGHQGDVDNKEEGSLVGAAAGAIIGGVVGYMVCAEEDTDGDGVPDSEDQCPNTPPGAEVDANGCETDTDGDGVPDSKDQCPGTPQGVKVGANGCETDTDGDGVPDSKDQCPDTPQGAKVDANGCETDTDGDGVPDSKDQCPDTPQGVKVDANGCETDTDGDGVPDSKDQCPDTPEGSQVDESGCSVVGEKLLIIGINFSFDSIKIWEYSEKKLDKAAKTLNENPKINVRIEGHTDSTGSAEYNLSLSDKRAKAVKDYLVAKGIASERLETVGKGEEFPIASNETAEGRKINRRVEFVVISK